MNQTPVPRLSKLPFVIGDLLMIAVAAYVALYGSFLGPWQYLALVAAVAFGAWLLAWPFVLEFRAETKLAETSAVSDVTAKIGDLNQVATNIAAATAHWQELQKGSNQAVTAVEQIAQRVTAEAQQFSEVIVKLNESEKQHLRLEVEKMRRAEGDWLAITVRLLDNVHALFQAGVRSGQKNIIEQLGSFRVACLDTTRRMGLLPILPELGVPFDPKAHQIVPGEKAIEGGVVADLAAPGYTFQGRVIRLPVVVVKEPGARAEGAAPKEEKGPDPQLTFDEAGGEGKG
jgi:molecular chaperone GrpE (heat shock protein)